MNSSGKIIILLVTLSLYLIGISSKSISKRVSFIHFINSEISRIKQTCYLKKFFQLNISFQKYNQQSNFNKFEFKYI